MVARKARPHGRRQYTEGKGRAEFDRPFTEPRQGREKDRARLGKGIGAPVPASLKRISKKSRNDLFGEQTVLCGGASALVQAGLKCSLKPVIRPRWPYFECLHELKLIADLMNEAASAACASRFRNGKWGDVSVGPKIIDASVKKR